MGMGTAPGGGSRRGGGRQSPFSLGTRWRLEDEAMMLLVQRARRVLAPEGGVCPQMCISQMCISQCASPQMCIPGPASPQMCTLGCASLGEHPPRCASLHMHPPDVHP